MRPRLPLLWLRRHNTAAASPLQRWAFPLVWLLPIVLRPWPRTIGLRFLHLWCLIYYCLVVNCLLPVRSKRVRLPSDCGAPRPLSRGCGGALSSKITTGLVSGWSPTLQRIRIVLRSYQLNECQNDPPTLQRSRIVPRNYQVGGCQGDPHTLQRS